jgi:hypothetical protein
MKSITRHIVVKAQNLEEAVRTLKVTRAIYKGSATELWSDFSTVIRAYSKIFRMQVKKIFIPS